MSIDLRHSVVQMGRTKDTAPATPRPAVLGTSGAPASGGRAGTVRLSASSSSLPVPAIAAARASPGHTRTGSDLSPSTASRAARKAPATPAGAGTAKPGAKATPGGTAGAGVAGTPRAGAGAGGVGTPGGGLSVSTGPATSGGASSASSPPVSHRLLIHGRNFSPYDLVLNPASFQHVEVGDVVELDVNGTVVVLKVETMEAVKGALQVSVAKNVADVFDLATRADVQVRRVLPQNVALDVVVLSFKDRFISRRDMWLLRNHVIGTTVYQGKDCGVQGIRVQARDMLMDDRHVRSGLVTEDTRLLFRSRTSRVFVLIQLSAEMWDFTPSGEELHFEKAIRFLEELTGRWAALGVSHSLTLIFFARAYFEDHTGDSAAAGGDGGADADGTQPASSPATKVALRDALEADVPERQYAEAHSAAVIPGYASPLGPPDCDSTVQRRADGLWYQDFYTVVADNEMRASGDWQSLLFDAKRSFMEFKDSVRTKGTISNASSGNVLEAVNLTMDIFERDFINRDLTRTGQSIVVVSAGSGVHEVDNQVLRITKQRMTDEGIGCDMICLGQPPLHVVPLFRHVCASGEENTALFHLPNWLNCSFYDPDGEDEQDTFALTGISDRDAARVANRKREAGGAHAYPEPLDVPTQLDVYRRYDDAVFPSARARRGMRTIPEDCSVSSADDSAGGLSSNASFGAPSHGGEVDAAVIAARRAAATPGVSLTGSTGALFGPHSAGQTRRLSSGGAPDGRKTSGGSSSLSLASAASPAPTQRRESSGGAVGGSFGATPRHMSAASSPRDPADLTPTFSYEVVDGRMSTSVKSGHLASSDPKPPFANFPGSVVAGPDGTVGTVNSTRRAAAPPHVIRVLVDHPLSQEESLTSVDDRMISLFTMHDPHKRNTVGDVTNSRWFHGMLGDYTSGGGGGGDAGGTGKPARSDVARRPVSRPPWLGLCEPAILPLTTDYFPDEETLDAEYVQRWNEYVLDSGENVYEDDLEKFVNELVLQRLLRGFQVIPKVRHWTGGQAEKAVPAVATVYLSSAHQFHVLRLFNSHEKTAVKVATYTRRAATHVLSKVPYAYCLHPLGHSRFRPMPNTISYVPDTDFKWSQLDEVICSHHTPFSSSSLFMTMRIEFALMDDGSKPSTQQRRSEAAAGGGASGPNVGIELLAKGDIKGIRSVSEAVAAHAASTPSPDDNPYQSNYVGFKTTVLSQRSYAFPEYGNDVQHFRTEIDSVNKLLSYEWVDVKIDKLRPRPHMVTRLAVNWLVASGAAVDDFVLKLTRRAKARGYIFTQVPIFRMRKLHPFRVTKIFLMCYRDGAARSAVERLVGERLTTLLGFSEDTRVEATKQYHYVHRTGCAVLRKSETDFFRLLWITNSLVAAPPARKTEMDAVRADLGRLADACRAVADVLETIVCAAEDLLGDDGTEGQATSPNS